MSLAPPPTPSGGLAVIAASTVHTTALARLSKAVSRLRQKPDLVRSRLAWIRSHPERVEEIAAKSYLHSNGFAKVRLFEGHGVCFRLHIWPAGEKRIGDVDPHGHRWEFASWVAVGPGMSETHFLRSDRADPDASLFESYDYGREAGAGCLRSRGPAWLRTCEPVIRPTGSVYSCGRDVLHTVAPVGDDLVATVVLQGPVVADSARVYRRPGQNSDAVERPITPDELDALFGAVDAAVGARGRHWLPFRR